MPCRWPILLTMRTMHRASSPAVGRPPLRRRASSAASAGPILAALATTAMAQTPDPAAQYERSVLTNVTEQPYASGTVADLSLPRSVLAAIVDDEIQTSYRRANQVVYADVPRRQPTPPASPERSADTSWIEVRVHELPETLTEYATLPDDRPALRGFRMPVGAGSVSEWPTATPEDPTLRAAAALVARRLATDGLLATTARAIELIGVDRVAGAEDGGVGLLARVGLPVDLLRHFADDDESGLLPAMTSMLASGADVEEVVRRLGVVPFAFEPSMAGFVIADEAGGGELELLRLQLPKGTYWRGRGGGDPVDVAGQLAERVPDVPMLITIGQTHLARFRDTAASWRRPPGARMLVVAEPFEVSRWAQDSGKGGYSADGRPATIVPRFASRRHDAPECNVGDSLISHGLRASGHQAGQSPLLFQGGNVLGVHDPATDAVILLLGESEIARNTSLGLTTEQVRAAFERELGADRSIVLPSASYHLDFEVSPRVIDGALVAFVNDHDAACRIILEAGLAPLVEGGVLTADAAAAARAALAAGDDRSFLGLVAGPLYGRSRQGAYPLSLADRFGRDDADSGIGNLQRYLVALDLLIAATLEPQQVTSVPTAQAYLRSLSRSAARRRALHARLEAEGWRLVKVPSLSAGDRSICALNGIHDRSRYIMPAYGGLYAALDAAAQATFEAELGPAVSVIPIRCGEAQRRVGGVHCSASAFVRSGSSGATSE